MITNNTLSDVTVYGIGLDHSKSNTVISNRITNISPEDGSQGNGLNCVNADSNSFINNDINNCGYFGMVMTYSSYNSIISNRFGNSAQSSLFITDNCYNNYVALNYFDSNSGQGFSIFYSDSNIFEKNNIPYSPNIDVYSMSITNGSHNVIMNNYWYNTDSALIFSKLSELFRTIYHTRSARLI